MVSSDPISYPWDNVTNAALVRVFRSSTDTGTLNEREFERLLDKLGMDGRTFGRPMFDAFDQDNSGAMDLHEFFLGMALLLSSREERLKNAFTMLDANESGGISREEVEMFLRTVSPASASRQTVRSLAAGIISDADANKGGTVSFSEFMAWPGKQSVLDWIDEYHERVLTRYGYGAKGISAGQLVVTPIKKSTYESSYDPLDVKFEASYQVSMLICDVLCLCWMMLDTVMVADCDGWCWCMSVYLLPCQCIMLLYWCTTLVSYVTMHVVAAHPAAGCRVADLQYLSTTAG